MSRFNLFESHRPNDLEVNSLSLSKGSFVLESSKKSWLGRLWDNLTHKNRKVLDEVIKESKHGLQQSKSIEELDALSENLKMIVHKEAANQDPLIKRRIEGLARIQFNCQMKLKELIHAHSSDSEAELQNLLEKHKNPVSKEDYVHAYKDLSHFSYKEQRRYSIADRVDRDGIKSLMNRANAAMDALCVGYRLKNPGKTICFSEDKIFELRTADLIRESKIVAEAVVELDLPAPQFIELDPEVHDFLDNPTSFKINDSNLERMAKTADNLDMPILRRKCDFYALKALKATNSKSKKSEILQLASLYDLAATLQHAKSPSSKPVTPKVDENFFNQIEDDDSATWVWFNLEGFNIRIGGSISISTNFLSTNPRLSGFVKGIQRHVDPAFTKRTLELAMKYYLYGTISDFTLAEAADLYYISKKYPSGNDFVTFLENYFSKSTISMARMESLNSRQRDALMSYICTRSNGCTFDSSLDGVSKADLTQREFLDSHLKLKEAHGYTLLLNGEEFYVDFHILRQNPFFVRLLEQSGSDSSASMTGLSAEAAKRLLEFLYYGSIDQFSSKEAVELYQFCADNQGLESLKNYLKMNFEKVPPYFVREIDLKKHKAMVDDYILPRLKTLFDPSRFLVEENGIILDVTDQDFDLNALQPFKSLISELKMNFKGLIQSITSDKLMYTCHLLCDAVNVKKVEVHENAYGAYIENPFYALSQVGVEEVVVHASRHTDFSSEYTYLCDQGEHWVRRSGFLSCKLFTPQNPAFNVAKIHTLKCVGPGPFRFHPKLTPGIRHLAGNVEFYNTNGEFLYPNLETIEVSDLSKFNELVSCKKLREIHCKGDVKGKIPVDFLEFLAANNPNLVKLDINVNNIAGSGKKITELFGLLNGRSEETS